MSEIKYLDYEGLEELVSLLDSRRTADNLAVTLALNQINEDIGDINIGNGTLTITRNNESLGTFTANQSSNATIDIDVPESISDFGNDGVQEILNIIKYGLPDVSELTEELKAALEETHNYAKVSQLADYGKSIAYDSGNKKIQLKNGNTVLSEISAADFLVDGMIEDVKIAKGTGANINKDCLIFDFNTDSGITDIEIPIADIFDSSNYYTKDEIDATLADYATEEYVDGKIDDILTGEAGLLNYYTKDEIDGKLFVPTIDFIPVGTTLTYTKDEETYDFKIGDFVRVVDETKPSGYRFYLLYDINNGVAVWGEYSEKTPPTYTPPTANTLTYNGEVQTLVTAGSTEDGIIKYSLDGTNWSTTLPTATDADTYNVYWKLIGDAGHGSVLPTVINVTIDKVTPTYTNPTAKSLTYNRQNQELLTAGSTDWGTFMYSEDESDWSDDIPAKTNAGQYPIFYRVLGDDNINTSSILTLNTSIIKVTPTVVAPEVNLGLVYTGEPQELVTAGSTDYGTLKYSNASDGTYTTTVPTETNAGTYDVWYKVEGDSNINDVAERKLTITIDKDDAAYIAPTAKSGLVYTGSALELINAGSTEDGTILYSKDNTNWSTSIPTEINASNYTVYWRIVGDSNHNNKASDSINCYIDKASGEVTTTPTAKILTYNNTSQQLINAGSGTGVMYYKLGSGEWSTEIPAATAAGTYTVQYKAIESANYYESDIDSLQITITKVTPTVTAPTAKVLTYNTSAQELVNAGSTNWGTLQYNLDNSTWSTSIPTATNFGNYTVYYRVVGDSNINDIASASVACSIAEKRVSTPTVTLSPNSYTYSGNACEPVVTVKDGTTVIPASEYTVTYTNNVNAGTATVTITDNTAGNYDITGSTTFTIAKAAGSVKTAPTAKSLTYNNTAQALINAGASDTGTMMYKVGSGEWSSSIPTATNADTYTVYYKAAESANYNESGSNSVSVTISKVTPTVTAPTAKSLTYTGSAQTLANAGSTNWGTLQYSLDNSTWGTSVPTGTNATSYTVYYRVVGNSNINDVASKSISCSIGKANPAYTAPTAKTGLVYTGSAQSLLNAGSTSHGTIEYSSNNSSWSTTIPTGTNANTSGYTSYWRLIGDSNHNDVSSQSISTVIAKASGSVSPAPTAKSLTYNGSNQTLANAGSGTGTMYYSLTNSNFSTTIPSLTNAGSWTLYYYAAESSNYNLSSTGSITVSIANKSISIPTPTGYSAQYDGGAHTATFGAATGASITKYRYSSNNSSWTESTSNPSLTNVGTLYTQAYYTAGTNYTGSGWSSSATITISRNKSATASAVSLTYNGTTESNGSALTGVTGSNVSWSGTTSGINAGSYTAYATPTSNYAWSDGTYALKTISWSIARRGLTAPVLNGASAVYHNTATASVKTAGTVSGSTAAAPGTLTWSNQSRTAVGSQTATAYYAATATNFSASAVSAGVTVLVTKATDQSITVTTTARTYTGSAQVVASASSHGCTYYLGFGSSSTSAPSSWGSANSSISATNAGTYYIWYKGTADGNHSANIGATYKGTVVISKADQSAPTASGATSTYPNTATATTSGGGGVGSIEWSNGSSRSTAGSQKTKARWSGNSNYNASAWSNEVTITVNKANPSYTAPTAKSGLTYSGSSQTLYNAGSNTTAGSFSYSNGTRTNAGSLTVTWSFTPTDTTNYNSASGSFTGSIAKANGSISFTTAPSTVKAGNTITVAATRSGDGTISYSSSNTAIATVSGSTVTGVDSGTVTITATVAEGTNHKSASTSYTLTVTSDFVNLGLSVKWAKGNICKDSSGNYYMGEPTDNGCYFSWGNIDGHNLLSNDLGNVDYNFGTYDNLYMYKNSSGGSLTANISSNDANHDAALKYLGSPYRMPTKTEFEELINNCTFTMTSNYNNSGVKGLIVKSNKTGYTDKEIFFPYSGHCSYNTRRFESFLYPTSTIKSGSTNDAYAAYCPVNDDSPTIDPTYRYYGRPIRAVQ